MLNMQTIHGEIKFEVGNQVYQLPYHTII